MNTAMKFNADAFLKWQKMQKEYFKQLKKKQNSKKGSSSSRRPFSDITNIPHSLNSQKYTDSIHPPSKDTHKHTILTPSESENSLSYKRRFDSFGKPPSSKMNRKPSR
jgi:hypothetical protein